MDLNKLTNDGPTFFGCKITRMPAGPTLTQSRIDVGAVITMSQVKNFCELKILSLESL